MKIRTSREVNASADAVWNVLGERFGEISGWFDPVVKSRMDGPLAAGATRICDVKAVGPVPEGEVVEQLTHFDRDARSLTFQIRAGVPGFMRLVENAWTVEQTGANTCTATSIVTINLAWYALPMTPLIKMQLGKTLASFVVELEKAAAGQPAENPVLAPEFG